MRRAMKTLACLMTIGAGVATAPSTAKAGTTVDCLPYDVQFFAGLDATHPEQMMAVNCLNDPTSYRAYYGTNGDSCGTLTIKQVTAWMELLTSSYLSGLPVILTWTQQTGACSQVTLDSVRMQ